MDQHESAALRCELQLHLSRVEDLSHELRAHLNRVRDLASELRKCEARAPKDHSPARLLDDIEAIKTELLDRLNASFAGNRAFQS